MNKKSKLGTHRLVHLDLKRAPLKVDYLQEVFPLFHEWGTTGLLIEWEDTFPYYDNLECIGSCNTQSKAYSEKDVDRILKLAEESHLSVIPLVQTFGHLEFVLRHEEWQELREVWKYTNALCPSNPKSLSLITNMIDQVISRMPKSLEYFHIGADEVWLLGSCSFCSAEEKHTVFLKHLVNILKYIKKKYPHIQPIMWDDMLRTAPLTLIKDHGLADFVDIMVWFYEPAPHFSISDELWTKYTTLFKNIWIASSFKGSTGACQILPVLQHHISNHEQWLSHINKTQTDIKGIAITGWSRYDHFATLCELLPTALPCLAICLGICEYNGHSQEVFTKISEVLGYIDVPLLMNPYPRPQRVAHALNFPGWKLCTGMEWFANLKGKHLSIMNSDQIGGWMNNWQISTGFISAMQVQGILKTLFEIEKEWEALEMYMREHMSEAYYPPQVEEWIATHCQPLREKAQEMLKSGQEQAAIQLRAESHQFHTFYPKTKPI